VKKSIFGELRGVKKGQKGVKNGFVEKKVKFFFA
jgi:hypothetical protein